ncbi:MAG: 4-carboxymuconolactone decarboxylase [Clostridiales bacterium]|jgi:4-carboxymuconolactone decarboxylase|nr:4-carboxymuconolactone decarboxylase [Clostridiales bacterium]
MIDKYNLMATDPEFIQRHEAFASDEVVNEDGQTLDNETRYMAILATLLGCQGVETFKVILAEALDQDFSPIMAKEIVYQAVDYLGFGRVYPFLTAANDVMADKGIQLPLEDQATTTMTTRLEKGSEAQMAIFGPGMKDFWRGGHMNRWLAANCFGDYYTRKGLDLKQRELITFCFLAAQGGCESQLSSHIFGNLNLGNDKSLLIKVVSQCLPFIGYPRSLNAVAAIQKVTEEMQKNAPK